MITMKTKTIITLVLAFLFTAVLQAQENDEEMKLLFHKKDKPANEKIANGGYGGISIGWTQIDGKSTMLFGARAAWIANHFFALGFAGNGFYNGSFNNDTYNAEDYSLAGGYGGLLVEPIIFPMSPVHVSFPVIFGAGGVTAAPPGNWEDYDPNSNYYDNYYYDSDFFYVIQPGVEAEFNIVKFFRVAIGASYRFTDGINLQYKYFDSNNIEQTTVIDKNALNGFNANITFKFGWF